MTQNVGKRIGIAILLFCAFVLFLWNQKSGGTQIYELFLNGELTVEQDEKQITIDELFGDNDIEYCFLDIDGDEREELHIRDNTAYYVIKDADGEPQIFFQSWWRDYEPVVTDEQCGFLNYFNLGYGTNERICFLKMDADGKREWDEVYWSDENENRYMDEEDKFTRETDSSDVEEIDMEQYLQHKDKYYVNQNDLVWTVRRLKEFETWQEAYTDFLLKSKITWFYNEPEDKYALAYLDEDDIPELICYTAGGNNVIVVTFYNGKVRILNPSTWGKIKYMEYDGRFYVEDDDCDVYLLKEGKFSLIGRGWDYGQYYFYTGYRYRYFWEGTEVTEGEYEECINKVIDTSKCIEPSLVYTEDEMLEMIGDNDGKNY